MSRHRATATNAMRFVGQNIKGNPAMSGRKVRHDLLKVRAHSDVFGLQEFEWRWYWRVANLTLLMAAWRLFPTRKGGLAHPVDSGQPLGWRRRVFARVEVRVALLMHGRAKISDTRWIRGVLLKERSTGLHGWFVTTHFVVGGDGAGDSKLRKAILGDNLDRLEAFLKDLLTAGDPVLCEIDGNIHNETAAYKRLAKSVGDLGGKFHGDLGVEYLFTIPGETAHFVVDETWTIPTSELYTDHEGRGVTFRLVEGSA